MAGHLVWSLPLLAARLTSTAARALVWATYYVLPNLDRFNVRAEAVHGDPVTAGYLVAQTVYGAGWVLVLVLGAAFVFSRRDLT